MKATDAELTPEDFDWLRKLQAAAVLRGHHVTGDRGQARPASAAAAVELRAH